MLRRRQLDTGSVCLFFASRPSRSGVPQTRPPIGVRRGGGGLTIPHARPCHDVEDALTETDLLPPVTLRDEDVTRLGTIRVRSTPSVHERLALQTLRQTVPRRRYPFA
jgi:hypothetical protein